MAVKKRDNGDPHARHEWDEWFISIGYGRKMKADDVHNLVLRKGKDFNCNVSSMLIQLRDQARFRGFKIRASTEGSKAIVVRRALEVN